jgi:hypothetical protein
MKSVLALLISFVFIEAQAFALSGGPVFPGNQQIQGEYAGVLIPDTSFVPAAGVATDTNALGLFDLNIPQTGLATGTFLMFSQGRVFTGTINAFGDPDSAEVQGILQATFTFSISFPVTALDPMTGIVTTTFMTQTIDASALGKLDAFVVSESNLFSSASKRITGTANLSIDQGQVDAVTFEPIITAELQLIVDGVQQSTTPGGSTTTP